MSPKSPKSPKSPTDLSDDDRQILRWLRDRAEIGDLIRKYSYGTDGRDFDVLRSIFADEFVCDYGPLGVFEGWEAFRAFAEATLWKFPMTQHVTTTDLIEIDGDRASTTFYGRNALHVPGPDGARLIRTGARYHQDLVRTDHGWKVVKHVCVPLWNDDQGGVTSGETMNSMAERFEGARPS
jgi:hypothetical protein